MTPAQQVALDAMRSAWPEETVQRMLSVDRALTLLSMAVDAADQQLCPYCGSRHGNGRDLSCTECHWFASANNYLGGVRRAEAELRRGGPSSHVCEGPRADCWCAGLQGGTPATSGGA